MSHLQDAKRLRHRYVQHDIKIPACFDDPIFPSLIPFWTLTTFNRSASATIFIATVRLSLVLLALIMVPGIAMAQDQFDPFSDDPKVPWHIVADEISYDDKANVYVGRGNVTITKMHKSLSADYVRFDQKTMNVSAQGNVMMTVGENILTGTKMEMNLNAETGTVYDGTIFLQENHYIIKGDKIQKIGKDSYAADKATVTTCDGDRPAWKITGRNLKITVEGYGTVKHAALWAKKIPVLYTPFLIFPVKLERQTGLLAPQFGYSDRKGTEYLQPFYWAINESSDATFYAHYMSDRGEKLGAEYRYVLDEQSKGTLMYDFLDDRQVDDGSPDSDKWGYEGDGILRPNSDRYWFRMKQDQALPRGFFARLDLDVVSDQDYFHEFKGGYTGFDEVDAYFIKEFGRGFDAYDDPVRLNRFNVSRYWPRYTLNAEFRWYDDVIARRQKETDTTLQRLPVITFDGTKQSILNSPLYFDLASEYTYFYSEDGPRHHRADIHPRVYLPYNYKHYFTVEPSAGIRETVWHFDKEQYQTSDKQILSREMYDLKVDLVSEIYNVFQFQGKTVEGIKHAIRPNIVYDYIPGKDQSDLPALDDIDRIDRTNLITYSLTNTLTSKVKRRPAENKAPPADTMAGRKIDGPPVYDYNEFLRFKLEQSYDIIKEKEDDPEPFSPINGRLELYPKKYLWLRADADWSTYDGNFLSRNIAAMLHDQRGDRLFVEYRYERDVGETVYTDARIKLSDTLETYGEYERNIFDGIDLKYGLGVLYHTQCWAFDSAVLKEGDDFSFIFMIRLYGIGEIG